MNKVLDFQQASKIYKYANVPFSKVKQLQYKQGYSKRVGYKLSFSDESVSEINIAVEGKLKARKDTSSTKVAIFLWSKSFWIYNLLFLRKKLKMCSQYTGLCLL